jgi:hypothetical protein
MANPRPDTSKLAPPWKPGQSGNLAGRPPARPLSTAYENWLRQPVTPSILAELRSKGTKVPLNATNADMVAMVLGRRAIKGDVLACKELREGVEGRSHMRIEINPDAGPPEFVVVYADKIPGEKEIIDVPAEPAQLPAEAEREDEQK